MFRRGALWGIIGNAAQRERGLKGRGERKGIPERKEGEEHEVITTQGGIALSGISKREGGTYVEKTAASFGGGKKGTSAARGVLKSGEWSKWCKKTSSR